MVTAFVPSFLLVLNQRMLLFLEVGQGSSAFLGLLLLLSSDS